jgi:hypothetical protein
MKEPILINRTATVLKHQLDFLIKREFFVTYYGYKKVLIYFGSWTLAVFGLFTLTDSDILIKLKVVLIALTAISWLVALGVIVTIFIKRQKRIRWRDTTIKSVLSKDEKIHMTFDNEKLTFLTDTHKTEIKWDYYKFYTEYKDSMFFIPKDNLYETISFATSEIGQINFNELIDIAKLKLKLLDDKNGR